VDIDHVLLPPFSFESFIYKNLISKK